MILARAAVHGERRDAGRLRDARDGDAVALRTRVAGADLERHRHVHGAYDRVEDAPDERVVAQQSRAGRHVAHLLRGASHVDVDDLRTAIDVEARGVGEHLGVIARDLYADRLGLALVI